MALQAELLTLLDNSDEPLKKRLKIAKDVFNGNDLPSFNKESILFNWLGKTCSKTDTSDVWETLHECVTSSHMEDISINDIKHNVLSVVIKAIIKQLKKSQNTDFKNNVIKCGIAVLSNDIFIQYFKHDLKHYCGLVSAIIINTEDVKIIREIISLNLSFNEKNFDKTEYVSNFLSTTFDALIKVLLKYNDNDLYKDVMKLIHRAVFSLNSSDLLNFLHKVFEENTSDEPITSLIFDKFQYLLNCDTPTAKCGVKLLFLTSLPICNTEILRYQMFILVLHVVGFKVQKLFKTNLPKIDELIDFSKALEILSEIFEIIHERNIVINESINEISFADFLKKLTVSIIRLQHIPNASNLKILTYIIEIDPLIIESSIDEIIALIILYKKDESMKLLYSNLMISIMKMYFKLRRVGKFYSVLLETLNKKINSIFKFSKPEIKFLGNIENISLDIATDVKEIFPNNVVEYFQNCITLQSGQEVTKIVRTCIYNLKLITDDFQSYSEDSKIFFVQITSEIICNILAAVKLADNNATDHSRNRFVDDMNSLREELKKFGAALLTVEHNHLLMFSFLNICYTWAEVGILLTYYTEAKNLNFKGEIDVTTLNNLSYLHNYLSSEQWSLILQRIKNFGEQPCKHILQKLLVQKLRAIFIFENEINESIEKFVISSYANNLETSWDLILSERFIASSFITKMESSQLVTLADLFIKYMIEKNNFAILRQRTIIDSRELQTSVFYVCLSKLTDLFKRKRKHGESVHIKPSCVKIFKNIDEVSFIKNETVDLEVLSANFSEEFNDIRSFKIKEESFCTFMEIIKYVPVTSLSNDVQVALFMLLLSICSDLRNCRAENVECLQKCEAYLVGLVENYLTAPNILCYIQSNILLLHIIESVETYKKLLSIIFGKGLTQNDSIPSCKSAINLLEKNIANDKYLDIVFVVIHVINNASLKNVSEENKAILHKYKDKLLKKLIKLIDENITDNKVIAYTLLLENCVNNKNEETLSKLNPLLKQYIDFAVNNINDSNAEEFLLLFKLILSKKSEISDIPIDYNISTWKACKNLHKVENYKHFSQIITLIFQDTSIQDFTNILQDMLQNNLNHIKSNEISNIVNELQIWKNLMNSTLSNEKNHIVTNMVQILFSNLAGFLTNNNMDQVFNKEFIDFQIYLIENQKVVLTPTIIDVHFQTLQILISKDLTREEFIIAFETSFQILDSLSRCRKELLMDRLPTFLLHFRLYLHNLCVKSNSDENLNPYEIMKITDCAFKIEKVIRNICAMKKDIVRITPYLIADFLKEYEKVPLYPDVKHHLNNSLMELIALCDNHAVSYLLRVLSPASTELFKEAHANYKKYFKFTGKV